MSTTTTHTERFAAAGSSRATALLVAPVSMQAIDVQAHLWTAKPSIATGTKRYDANPPTRPEEAGP